MLAHPTDQPKRVALYARVSTLDKGQDPETQLRPLREYAQRRGLTVVEEYVDRASGMSEERMQYKRPTATLGALVSDKINQWTLLVGMIPVVYAFGTGHLTGFPLDARQHEEFFLTAAQSLFAVALLLRLRLGLTCAVTLLTLFVVQFGLAFVFQHNEARTIQVLTGLVWFYLALAGGALFLEPPRVAAVPARGAAGPPGAGRAAKSTRLRTLPPSHHSPADH